MAKKSMILKQQAPAKYSTRKYNRCKVCGRPRVSARLWSVPYLLPRDGLQGRNPRRAQGQLVKALILPGGAGFLPWSAQA